MPVTTTRVKSRRTLFPPSPPSLQHPARTHDNHHLHVITSLGFWVRDQVYYVRGLPPALPETNSSPWKSMVGRCISLLGWPVFRAMWVSGSTHWYNILFTKPNLWEIMIYFMTLVPSSWNQVPVWNTNFGEHHGILDPNTMKCSPQDVFRHNAGVAPRTFQGSFNFGPEGTSRVLMMEFSGNFWPRILGEAEPPHFERVYFFGIGWLTHYL